MALDFHPAPRDPRIDPLLRGLPLARFDESLFYCCEVVDRYAADWAVELARRLELVEDLHSGASADELAAARGFAPAFRPALEWLLGRLAASGLVTVDGSETAPRFQLQQRLPEPELAALRALGLASDPRIAPTFDILDAAAEAWPAVARGEGSGEKVLFGVGRLSLWLAYFHNQNPIYAVNNLLAAAAAVAALRPGGGVRVLEVGAGAGSASEALLDALAERGRLADLAEYRLTEPNAFFRRRAERGLAERFPGVPIVSGALDVDRPLAAQGIETGSYDLLLAVNVLHVARDLRATLLELRGALAPGGILVAGEAMRLFPGQPIPAEMVFELFSGFTSVELDPELRPNHGFLTPEVWRRALAATGFVEVEIVPDLERVRDYYPRFYAGAVRGRKPSV